MICEQEPERPSKITGNKRLAGDLDTMSKPSIVAPMSKEILAHDPLSLWDQLYLRFKKNGFDEEHKKDNALLHFAEYIPDVSLNKLLATQSRRLLSRSKISATVAGVLPYNLWFYISKRPQILLPEAPR